MPPRSRRSLRQISTSHQNAKANVSNLQKLGFIDIYCDDRDRRVLRLRTTEENRRYREMRESGLRISSGTLKTMKWLCYSTSLKSVDLRASELYSTLKNTDRGREEE